MIMTQLTLENFRVFHGKHSLHLAPKTADAPIVLCRGLNGSGKSTILSAIRLVLFGKRALNHSLTQASYIHFLTQQIHHSPQAKMEQAQITLSLNYQHEDQCHQYTICRSWQAHSADTLRISQNQVALADLSNEQAQSLIYSLIPLDIVDLFFFDGEKITQIAEDTSGKALQKMLQQLLGITLIRQLKKDLQHYLNKQQTQSLTEPQQHDLAVLEKQQQEHETNVMCLRQQADLIATQIQLLAQDILSAETELNLQGGAWAAQRQQQQQRFHQLQQDKKHLEAQIQQELAAYFPLNLARNTLTQLQQQLTQEQALQQKRAFQQQLDVFLQQLEHQLINDHPQLVEQVMQSVTSVCQQDQFSPAQEELVFEFSKQQTQALHQQMNLYAPQSLQHVQELQQKLVQVEKQLAKVRTELAQTPLQENIQEHLNKIRKIDKQQSKLKEKYRAVLQQAKHALQQALAITYQAQKYHLHQHQSQRDKQAIDKAKQCIQFLETFENALVLSRNQQLEQAFTTAYQNIASKNTANIRAKIEAETARIRLIDQGTEINMHHLSAGEKHIYVLAMLQALAQISTKKLPIIIDTALGRLDSLHRQQIVEKYLSKTKQQMIMLATDAEIDDTNLVKLQSCISHAYVITYDDQQYTSSIQTYPIYHQQPSVPSANGENSSSIENCEA